MAELSQIKFQKGINSELFAREAVREKSVQDNNDAMYKTIQVGEAGEIDDMVEGQNSTLPLTVDEREDDVKEYTTQLISPKKAYLIRSDEDKRLLAVSYDKQKDLYKQINDKMIKKVNDISVNEWGSNDNIVVTTGATSRATTIVGATGNRKRLTYDNLVAVREKFNKFDIGNEYGSENESQFALLTPDMITDLYLLDKLTDMEKVAIMNVINGNVRSARIMGFNIMMRWNKTFGHTGVSYTEAATPLKKARGSAVVVTDNAAAIFWDRSLVRSALSPIKASINRNLAAYAGGDLYYTEARFGATIKRSDEVGVVALVEDNA